MTYRNVIIIILVFFVGCEKEHPQENDSGVLENFTIVDVNGSIYVLKKTLNEHDYLLLFGFATWCHWSQKSVPQIQNIDSLYSDKIKIIGIEGSPTYSENEINRFIESYKFDIPIVIRVDNIVLNSVLYPDSVLSFPSLVLINTSRKIIYRQSGYSENMVDSIAKYTN